jgi:hypothetical protein
MDKSDVSDKTRGFLQILIEHGDQEIINAVDHIFKEAEDEEAFIEDVDFYLTRLSMRVKELREALEPLKTY